MSAGPSGHQAIDKAVEAAHALEEATAAWLAEWAARPKLRGWLHVAAAPSAATGIGLLIARRDRGSRAGLTVYGAGLVSMFAVSATYHRLSRSYPVYRFTRHADHATIFAAIAGTATPLALTSLPERARRPALVALWGSAVVAAVGEARSLHSDRRGKGWGYAALSTLAAAMLPSIIVRHGARTTALVVAGGAAYAGGAAVFATHRPDPWPEWFGYHEIWHAATVAGAGFHLAAIASATRPAAPAAHPLVDLVRRAGSR